MTDLSRRTFTTLFGASAFALAFARPDWATAATARDTLNFLLPNDPGTLSNLSGGSIGAFYIGAKINEGLVSYDHDQNPMPLLASAWEVSEDARIYTFHLRDGVKWHDGTPFTSRDVAYSIRTLREHHPRGRSVFAGLVDIDATDPLKVVVTLEDPVPYFLYFLQGTETPIVAAHLYEGSDPLANPVNNAPVGTGPFKFKEWVPGSHVILEKNAEYWDLGKPTLATIVYKIIVDPAARAVAIETGEVDLAVETPISRNEISRLAQLPNIAVESASYEDEPFYTRLEFRLANEHLADLRVRQAIAHAIDKQLILDVAYLGQGAIATGPLQPGSHRFYTRDVTLYDFDVSKAEALLDEAGFPRGADGTRFTLRLQNYPAGPDHRSAAEIVKQALIAVGIGIEHNVGDVAAYIQAVYTDAAFDLNLTPVNTNKDPAIGVHRLFWSRNIKPGVAFSNGSGYSNPEVDRILEAAAIEPDLTKRQALYVEFQQILTRDLPEVPLVAFAHVTLANAKLKDYVANGDGVKGDLASAWFET
ncbi:ABC transporter substrate-binding protein [Celeribacter indicus]|uniref:Oligopeptide ABC transporter substrate binding protein n=1 Tax=Celeribacter indicus TaxID=1208324 RepID=A0A0B5E5T1_9RHOB|nr:ABC transporter substrate-binding protein [Celeribacter indicus]AJE48750.1 oligopeptide ABC transporter substrate binding protein [Celeribacter indicus]SDX11475.1 peptide/nickel transport system substrate-binding protein [Celeribacter indicus]